MVIPFSVDPDALECSRDDISISVMIHRRIISEWRKHGLLVHSDGPLQGSAIVKAVEALPQECRKLWKAALTYNRRRPADIHWDGTFPNDAIEGMTHLAGQFKLALLESTRAVIVGKVGVHEASRIEQELANMELCKFHAMGESTYLQKAEALSTHPLAPNAPCGSEWNSRYTECLKHANHITVVDRYILANHERRRKRNESSGLKRLLNDCFSRPRNKPARIKLICAVQNNSFPLSSVEEKEVKDYLQDLATTYSGGGIARLECHILTDQEFAKHCHTRYFRVDYLVLGIDSGIDAFGGATSERGSVVWRNDILTAPYFSQQEAKLQAHAIFVKQIV